MTASSSSPSTRAASAASSAQRRLCPPMYGDLRSMKSATTVRASSSSAPASMRWGSGSRASTASHGSISPSRSNQPRPCSTNRSARAGSYVRSRRSRAASSAWSGEKRRPIASMSWLRCTTRIASGIASPCAWVGIAVAVPALEREAQRLANVGAEVEPLHEHVGDLAPGREVVDRPLAGRLLDHPDDLVALLRAAAGRREGDHVAHHLRGVARRRARASGRGSRSRRRTRWRPRGRGRCSRRTGAAPPSRRSRAPPRRTPRPRRSTSRAGTSAAATRAAARTRCPARAPAWRRAHRGEAVCRRWGVLPMYRRDAAEHNPRTTRRRCRSGRPATLISREDIMATSPTPTATPSRWESSPTRPARSRSSGSPTPTWPGWSSATSTPRAACSGRHLELHLEDGATDDAVAAAEGDEARRAGPGRRRLRRHLQLDEAGHQGPGRRRGQDALHLPRAVRGAGVRPAHLLHRPGAGAAGRPVHPVADAGDRREDVLPAVRRLHLAARDERARPGGRHGERRDDRRRGVLPARPRGLPRDGRADHRERRGRRVQHDRAARGRAVPRAAARLRLHEPRRAPRLHVLRGELPRHGADRARGGAVQLPRLLPGRQRPVQPEAARAVRRALSRRREVHGRQRLLGPLPRAAAVGRGRDGGRLARRRTT